MKKHERYEQEMDAMIRQEKEARPDPWLPGRVMARLSKPESASVGWFPVILKPALAVTSLLLVMWLGIQAGSSWAPEQSAAGVVLENDYHAEHFSFYTQSENE